MSPYTPGARLLTLSRCSELLIGGEISVPDSSLDERDPGGAARAHLHSEPGVTRLTLSCKLDTEERRRVTD